MSKGTDLLLSALDGNYSGWRYVDMERALRALDYEEVSSKGSHHSWKHPNDPRILTVPKHSGRDIPRGYVRELKNRAIALGWPPAEEAHHEGSDD